MIQITDKSRCCGCAACVQRCPKQCIILKEDNEGFFYPQADSSSCIECGLCEKVCPMLNPETSHIPHECYAAINPDEYIRKESSSGGVFTAIAMAVLAENGVVFGARFDKDWSVIHDYTETTEGLSAFRGSKYMQSRIGNTYRQVEEFLKANRKVLFSGTPCQIAGLRRFLRKTYSNLLTVDFICHGVPSALVWQRYLKEIQEQNRDKKIIGISFRDKVNGWKKYKVRIDFVDSKSKVSNFSEPFFHNIYMKGFLNDLYLRPSCHSCPAKPLKSGSDITIGDFWGINNSFPTWDDDKGTSCVLIHTEQGKNYFEQLNLKKITVSYKDILQQNPSLEKTSPINKKRIRFYKVFPNKPLKNNIDNLLRTSIYSKIKKRTRKIIQVIRQLSKA